jgi:hypothetical protein
MTATRNSKVTTQTDVLYLAFELGDKDWKLAFTIGMGQKPRLRSMPARDLPTLQTEIAKAKKRFGLAGDAVVKSCYEAGRDGFWLHRYLVSSGVENSVVDSASIEVNRRQRRPRMVGSYTGSWKNSRTSGRGTSIASRACWAVRAWCCRRSTPSLPIGSGKPACGMARPCPRNCKGGCCASTRVGNCWASKSTPWSGSGGSGFFRRRRPTSTRSAAYWVCAA